MIRRLKSAMIRRTARLELANTLMALGAPHTSARRIARQVDPRTPAEAQEAGRTLAAAMFDEFNPWSETRTR